MSTPSREIHIKGYDSDGRLRVVHRLHHMNRDVSSKSLRLLAKKQSMRVKEKYPAVTRFEMEEVT